MRRERRQEFEGDLHVFGESILDKASPSKAIHMRPVEAKKAWKTRKAETKSRTDCA